MQRTIDIIANNHPERAAPDALFEAICRDCAEDLHADLVSIWRFDGAKHRLVRRAVYDAAADRFEDDGMQIAYEQAPTYFRHIREDTVISAVHATSNPATGDLTNFYLGPLGIVSMLDFIIHRPGFEPYGVICCENRHGPREWSDDDVTYLRRIAAVAALHFT